MCITITPQMYAIFSNYQIKILDLCEINLYREEIMASAGIYSL